MCFHSRLRKRLCKSRVDLSACDIHCCLAWCSSIRVLKSVPHSWWRKWKPGNLKLWVLECFWIVVCVVMSASLLEIFKIFIFYSNFWDMLESSQNFCFSLSCLILAQCGPIFLDRVAINAFSLKINKDFLCSHKCRFGKIQTFTIPYICQR